MAPLFLGLINILLNVALLLLLGAVVLWICSMISVAVPANVQKIYLIIVALIALYQVASLIFGLPVYGLVRP